MEPLFAQKNPVCENGGISKSCMSTEKTLDNIHKAISIPPSNINVLQSLNLRIVKYSDNYIVSITKPVHLLDGIIIKILCVLDEGIN